MRKLAMIVSIALVTMACGDDGSAATTPQVTAPSGLTVTTVAGGAHLVWMDNSSDEAEFAVQRKTGSEAWSTVGTVPANMTQYHDAAVTAGAAYMYRVLAIPASGDANAGAASNEVMFMAPSDGSMGTSGAGGAPGAGSGAGTGGASGTTGEHTGGQHG